MVAHEMPCNSRRSNCDVTCGRPGDSGSSPVPADVTRAHGFEGLEPFRGSDRFLLAESGAHLYQYDHRAASLRHHAATARAVSQEFYAYRGG